MTEFPVAGLVGQDTDDFVIVHLLQQGIKQDDTLDPADPREISVGMFTAPRCVDLLHPVHLQPGPGHNTLDSFCELIILQRLEFEKQWLD